MGFLLAENLFKLTQVPSITHIYREGNACADKLATSRQIILVNLLSFYRAP
ncbi:hypothetical protein JHK82_015334 [Glycine max]|uniref:Uncharacterized protein n=2 Tax=Glycine subgen. Soja TaxID=1462606 RepID=K7KV59_SOYBN|nr:hypothetical protein JHK87_015260 [Glycine soja]KAG5031735.1 hypothetical protein JHK85_015717 [Glycine max]KAG5045955.1 hypothetical protein JHK86_015361 [Glycine max]KAG5148453.1 hypothetical protein JHK82_015334 [Glycine max]KAH1125998.1 hypothetical protein GYH30_015158 [Glycine max]